MRECVVVVGGGTMGAGIVQSLLLVQPDVDVYLVERDDSAADRARDKVVTGLQRRLAKLGQNEHAFADRLHVVADLPQAVEPTFVIEAVYENLDVKEGVLGTLAGAYPAAVIASNTSSLSIGALSASVPDPERFVGMHFFNPVPESLLVELVTSKATSDATVALASAWVERMGKQSIVVRDSPGFATTRLGVAIGLEAIRMLEEGVASAEDIDRAMVLGYKFPIGPIALTDLIGLDVRLAIADQLTGEIGERFLAPNLLRSRVAEGRLGKKVGAGFYDWPRP